MYIPPIASARWMGTLMVWGWEENRQRRRDISSASPRMTTKDKARATAYEVEVGSSLECRIGFGGVSILRMGVNPRRWRGAGDSHSRVAGGGCARRVDGRAVRDGVRRPGFPVPRGRRQALRRRRLWTFSASGGGEHCNVVADDADAEIWVELAFNHDFGEGLVGVVAGTVVPR